MIALSAPLTTTKTSFNLRPVLKGLLFLGVLLLAWQAIQNSTVNNALVSFLFAGIVPGTHTVLSPNTVMFGAIGIGLAGAVLLLTKATYSSRSARRRLEANDQPALQGLTTALLQPIMQAARQRTWQYRPLLETIRSTPPSLPSDSVARRLRRFTLITVAVTLDIANNLWITVKKLASLAWRHLHPQLQQLDSWLEQQTHAALAKAHKRLQRHDNFRFILQLIRQSNNPRTLLNLTGNQAVIKCWHKLRHKQLV